MTEKYLQSVQLQMWESFHPSSALPDTTRFPLAPTGSFPVQLVFAEYRVRHLERHWGQTEDCCVKSSLCYLGSSQTWKVAGGGLCHGLNCSVTKLISVAPWLITFPTPDKVSFPQKAGWPWSTVPWIKAPQSIQFRGRIQEKMRQ